MKKRLGILISGTLLLWALAVYPAQLLWGELVVVYSALAVLLCLAPTAVNLIWASKVAGPEQVMLMVLGGTALRMTFVLVIGLALYFAVPYFQQPSFWLCLLVCYLGTLALELGVLLSGALAAEKQS